MVLQLFGDGLLQVNKQWGLVGAGQSVQVNFPITFTNTEYAVVFNGEYSSNIEYFDMLTTARSKSGYTLFVGGSNNGGKPKKRYIAIGQQQWGYTSSKTATYPIALTSAFIALTTTNNGSSTNNYDDRPTFNTKTISTNVGNFYYAVFGK